MFTGIVKGLCSIVDLHVKPTLIRFGVKLTPSLWHQLEIGASVAIDGTCLTVVKIENNIGWFEAISETLHRTTLSSLKNEQLVNVERAAKWGDEIGGHMLSGHIYGKGQISHIFLGEDYRVMTLQVPSQWMKYFFSKGYVALDGVSLTLVDVDFNGFFTVHLIPETLQKTTLGFKRVGDLLNVEIDSQTQTIVETVERMIKK